MTISEIAEKTRISADTLRYYERIGLIPPVPRTAAGIRVYDDQFLHWIAFVQKLKAGGMSLEAIIDYIRLAREGSQTCHARKNLLLETRTLLSEKITTLQTIVHLADQQLANYEQLLLPETEQLIQQWTILK